MNEKRRCYNCMNCRVKIPLTQEGYIEYDKGIVHCAKDWWMYENEVPRRVKFLTGAHGSGGSLGYGKRKNISITLLAEKCKDYEEARDE